MKYRNLCSFFLWTVPAAPQTPCGSMLLLWEIGHGYSYISCTVNLKINFVCNIIHFPWLFLKGAMCNSAKLLLIASLLSLALLQNRSV